MCCFCLFILSLCLHRVCVFDFQFSSFRCTSFGLIVRPSDRLSVCASVLSSVDVHPSVHLSFHRPASLPAFTSTPDKNAAALSQKCIIHITAITSTTNINTTATTTATVEEVILFLPKVVLQFLLILLFSGLRPVPPTQTNRSLLTFSVIDLCLFKTFSALICGNA